MERAQIQLVLLEEPRDWRLDDDTKEIGREGIATARASIREALKRSDGQTAPAHRSAA
ncbi:MAG: hypothetical protein M3527_02115 [Actinomycetota bacterium]|nr:hypothetical protein [Acidimicrobiia bacterium]MDQ3293238.1 hypothetical protein [Actinomycetota bacterium]